MQDASCASSYQRKGCETQVYTMPLAFLLGLESHPHCQSRILGILVAPQAQNLKILGISFAPQAGILKILPKNPKNQSYVRTGEAHF